ncbi:hypothetical protein EW146_g5583 [Bondarzewia mesenterica]|uniref:Uncharacterized protein n=1 Tax=Bondarzewia mesenterica TaxID=1095465 RepID=A0A4S4LR27_9AGAM|nr:hypothetical protein EW146_g5583 [Bondarzewia mesenterica]
MSRVETQTHCMTKVILQESHTLLSAPNLPMMFDSAFVLSGSPDQLLYPSVIQPPERLRPRALEIIHDATILQLSLAIALSVPPQVSAWGNLGHESVGYVAMQFLSSNALSFVQSSLGSTYDESLGVAATWADSVRSQTAYKFSAPYHFIDAEVSAIQNYTARVQENVWDTGILTRSLNASYDGSPQTYADELVTRITSGEYSSLKSGWISCISTSALSGTSCPLVWAQEANAYDCSTVFDYSSNEDLCTSSYYTMAIPIIDLQIAKQGYRLAIWLNTIFD